MKNKRYIKIESVCDNENCDELHEVKGLAGVFAVLEKPKPEGGYDVATGFLALQGDDEVFNLVLSIIRMTYHFKSEVLLDVMEEFMHDKGVSASILERKIRNKPQIIQ